MPPVFLPIVTAWTALAVVTGLVLLRTTAPYGRHVRAGWGPTLPHRAGWVVMELVSPAALVLAFDGAGGEAMSGSGLLVLCWLGHYAYRAVVYPMRARWGRRRMPVLVAASAVAFNAVNGTLNGLALAWMPPGTETLAIGLVVWAAGLAINVHADGILLGLREPGTEDYAIPRGGLYRWISCPNYLGEIIEWTGFAVAAWNPAALSFAVWTVANLLPRALAHHRWYHERFDDYPAHRRALIPGIL